MQTLTIRFNGEDLYRHYPTPRLPGVVEARLGAMDELLAGHPEDERTLSVIRQVLVALEQDDSEKTAVLCSWLCRKLPGIAVIEVVEQGDEAEVSLQFG